MATEAGTFSSEIKHQVIELATIRYFAPSPTFQKFWKQNKVSESIKLALKHKDDLSELCSLRESVRLQKGLSVGAIWAVYQISKTMCIERALGTNFAGRLAMWQVIARVIEQGSRLSVVRLAQTHAACCANLLIVGKH